MALEQWIFYSVAAILLFASMMVITAKNPVRAALFLVLAFVASSFLWMLLEAEFLALILILVYVGAVMTLFLFVIMMLDINIVSIKEGFAQHFPLALLIAGLFVGQLIWVMRADHFAGMLTVAPVVHGADYSSIKALGRALFIDYLYPFELAGVLLLVAIVAAIGLTVRGPKQRRNQHPGKQVQVTKRDRLRMVSLSAEKKS